MKRFLYTLCLSSALSANAYAGWNGFEWGMSTDDVYKATATNHYSLSILKPVEQNGSVKEIIMEYTSQMGKFGVRFRFREDNTLFEIVLSSTSLTTCEKIRTDLLKTQPDNIDAYITSPNLDPNRSLAWFFPDNDIVYEEYEHKTGEQCEIYYLEPSMNNGQ